VRRFGNSESTTAVVSPSWEAQEAKLGLASESKWLQRVGLGLMLVLNIAFIDSLSLSSPEEPGK